MGKKWNRDAKPAEKMLSLYSLLLFSRYELSLSELARTLNCSKQTICRLIDQLEASVYGKVVRSQRGREALYSLDRPKELPRLNIDAEGLEQLALCRDFVLHLLPEEFRKNIDGTLRLATSYVSHAVDTAPVPLPIAESRSRGRIDYTGCEGILHTLMQAIKERRVCSMTYQSGPKAEIRAYEFAPKRLIAYHETIRICGWLVTDKGRVRALYENPATLPLHRFRSATLTARGAVKLPEPIDEVPGAFGLMNDEVFTAAIRFQTEAAAYVAERKWSADQKLIWQEDGCLLLELESKSWTELLSWVLSFGDSAEIISPEWFRAELVDRLRNMAGVYGLPAGLNSPAAEVAHDVS